MKYAHTIQPEERPEFMQEDWLKVALRELDLSSLPAQQRFFLEMEMAKEADIRESQEIWEAQAKEAIAKAKEAEAQAKEAYEKGMEKGMEKGIEKGIEKGMEKGMETHTEKAVLMLHDDGFPNELIAKYAVSTPEAVERILAKYKRKSHSLHKNGNGSNGKTNGKS